MGRAAQPNVRPFPDRSTEGPRFDIDRPVSS